MAAFFNSKKTMKILQFLKSLFILLRDIFRFIFEGIWEDLKTTLVGVLLAGFFYYLFVTEKATFDQISPFLVMIVPFLLYKGKSN